MCIISVLWLIAILANSTIVLTTAWLEQLSCLLDWLGLYLALALHPFLIMILSTKILLSQNGRNQLMTQAWGKQNPPMPIASLDGGTASWSRIQKESKRKYKSGTDQSKTESNWEKKIRCALASLQKKETISSLTRLGK